MNSMLDEALGAFMAVLDRYTLADLTARRADLRSLFGIIEAAQAAVPGSVGA